MKSKHFIKSFCIVSCFTILSVCPVTTMSVHAADCSSHITTQQNDTIQPRAAIIQWVHKEVDGKLYRRLYNFQTKEWIGDWILCE